MNTSKLKAISITLLFFTAVCVGTLPMTTTPETSEIVDDRNYEFLFGYMVPVLNAIDDDNLKRQRTPIFMRCLNVMPSKMSFNEDYLYSIVDELEKIDFVLLENKRFEKIEKFEILHPQFDSVIEHMRIMKEEIKSILMSSNNHLDAMSLLYRFYSIYNLISDGCFLVGYGIIDQSVATLLLVLSLDKYNSVLLTTRFSRTSIIQSLIYSQIVTNLISILEVSGRTKTAKDIKSSMKLIEKVPYITNAAAQSFLNILENIVYVLYPIKAESFDLSIEIDRARKNIISESYKIEYSCLSNCKIVASQAKNIFLVQDIVDLRMSNLSLYDWLENRRYKFIDKVKDISLLFMSCRSLEYIKDEKILSIYNNFVYSQFLISTANDDRIESDFTVAKHIEYLFREILQDVCKELRMTTKIADEVSLYHLYRISYLLSILCENLMLTGCYSIFPSLSNDIFLIDFVRNLPKEENISAIGIMYDEMFSKCFLLSQSLNSLHVYSSSSNYCLETVRKSVRCIGGSIIDVFYDEDFIKNSIFLPVVIKIVKNVQEFATLLQSTQSAYSIKKSNLPKNILAVFRNYEWFFRKVLDNALLINYYIYSHKLVLLFPRNDSDLMAMTLVLMENVKANIQTVEETYFRTVINFSPHIIFNESNNFNTKEHFYMYEKLILSYFGNHNPKHSALIPMTIKCLGERYKVSNELNIASELTKKIATNPRISVDCSLSMSKALLTIFCKEILPSLQSDTEITKEKDEHICLLIYDSICTYLSTSKLDALEYNYCIIDICDDKTEICYVCSGEIEGISIKYSRCTCISRRAHFICALKSDIVDLLVNMKPFCSVCLELRFSSEEL